MAGESGGDANEMEKLNIMQIRVRKESRLCGKKLMFISLPKYLSAQIMSDTDWSFPHSLSFNFYKQPGRYYYFNLISKEIRTQEVQSYEKVNGTDRT